MKVNTLENSIYWQKVVIAQSKCPKQIARCKKAIENLQAQIDAIKAKQ